MASLFLYLQEATVEKFLEPLRVEEIVVVEIYDCTHAVLAGNLKREIGHSFFMFEIYPLYLTSIVS